MSQKTADVKAMLDWLATCPLITTLNNGDVVLGIDYLGTGEPDMVPFSLESTLLHHCSPSTSEEAAGPRIIYWHPA